MRMNRLAKFVLFLAQSAVASAWTPKWSASRAQRPSVTMYAPPNIPISQSPALVAQKLLRNSGSPRVIDPSMKSSFTLSNSALAFCDSVPSFQTSHGLLSPETVVRLEELTSRGHRSEALVNFLDSYRRNGPLSCLPMLGDPDILPHLTKAMRDLTA